MDNVLYLRHLCGDEECRNICALPEKSCHAYHPEEGRFVRFHNLGCFSHERLDYNKGMLKMYVGLPKIEICCYLLTWLCGVSYSIYSLYLSGMVLRSRYQQDFFSSGWTLLRSKKDISDYEWAIWTDFLFKASLWFVCNSIGVEIIRWTYKQAIPMWYLFISTAFLVMNLGVWPTFFIFTFPCVIYVLSKRKNLYLMWGLVVTGMLVLGFEQGRFCLPDYWQYFFSASQSWILIRCVAFAMERISNQPTKFSGQELTTVLAYCLYFPALFLGPVIGYQEFQDGIGKPFSPWRRQHCISLVLNCLRFAAWWLFTEVALHFIYSSALLMHPQVVEHLSAWSLYGMGYCMGQFFMLKYVVIYGLVHTVASAEHIKAPRHPKCIARIYLYSDMWRNFDQGLYMFLKRYIYIPCLGGNLGLWRKLASSFMCFCFIFLWHKPYLSIFVWSSLNFIGILIENLCKAISETEIYKFWEDSVLQNQQNRRRFHAFISTPLFLMSALSNFYFFGDIEIGNIFVKRFFEGSLIQNAALITFAYCCCQVSIEISIKEEENKKLSHCKS